MNATFARDPMSFVMLASLSEAGIINRGTIDRTRNEPPRPGLTERIASAVKWLVELPRRNAVIQELSVLSDHELADIGLSRAELNRVFEPNFVAGQREMAAQRG
jgi:uncharacterized protein YjiS (DUF1127 family)